MNENEIANAIIYLADVIAEIGSVAGAIAILFLLFKNMGEREK